MSDDSMNRKKPVRHMLGLSGGKDSSALAIYMRDKVPEMEYFFADTGAELPETLKFIDKLQDYLGKPIVKLNPVKDFAHHLKLNGGFLPTALSRWCTSELKIRPFEEYVGGDEVITYVGIRADEQYRKGYDAPGKPNIQARYPFIEAGITKADVFEMLEESGLGAPKYYEWRSRSGCYFCFFQQKNEWVGLADHHPDLFQKAIDLEDFHLARGRDHTWSEGERLGELLKRRIEIKTEAQLRAERDANKPKKRLCDQAGDDEDGELACFTCHL